MSELKSIGLDIATTVYNEGVPWRAAKLIAAQTMLETANYTSNVFLTDNNVGGMKMPKVRQSPYITGKGLPVPSSEGNDHYAHYSNPIDGAKDMLHLFKYNKVNYDAINTPMDWASWLKSKSYYGSSLSNYAQNLEHHLKAFDGVIEPVTVSASKKKKYVAWAIAGGVMAFCLIVIFVVFRKFKGGRYGK